MFIKMKESKGFTLVELMIVVAIIGILAAVAVPFYQKYIQKSRLTSKVWPGVHAIETNLASYYSFQSTFPTSTTSIFSDADTRYFTPSLNVRVLNIRLKGTAFGQYNNGGFTATPVINAGKITTWTLAGTIIKDLGLNNE